MPCPKNTEVNAISIGRPYYYCSILSRSISASQTNEKRRRGKQTVSSSGAAFRYPSNHLPRTLVSFYCNNCNRTTWAQSYQRFTEFPFCNAAATKVQRCFTPAVPVRRFCFSFGSTENVAMPTLSSALFQLFHIFMHTQRYTCHCKFCVANQ